MPKRPDLPRLMEPGNFLERLLTLERQVRRLEARSGLTAQGLDSHTHSALDLNLLDDSACPATVDLTANTGSQSWLARRDHEHALDLGISPTWSAGHKFSVSPSMAGLSASNGRLQEVADPQVSSDAATRGWVTGSYSRRWPEPFAAAGSATASGTYLGWLGNQAWAVAESTPPLIVAGSVIGLAVRASLGPGAGNAELYRVFIGAASTGASVLLAGTATCQWQTLSGITFSASQSLGLRRESVPGSPWASASDVRLAIWLEQS